MISSAARALRILMHFSRAKSPLAITDIARLAEISPPTAFRDLQALEMLGLLERYQSSSQFVVGPVLRQLHRTLLLRFTLREIAKPYIDQIVSLTGGHAVLDSRVGWYSLRLHDAHGPNDVHDLPPVGFVEKLHLTFSGNTMLAQLSATERSAYCDWASLPMAERTEMEARWAEIRDDGHAIEPMEAVPNRAMLAVPIRHGDRIIASVASDGFMIDGKSKKDANMIDLCKAAVRSLEAAIEGAPAEIAGPFAHLDPSTIDLSTL